MKTPLPAILWFSLCLVFACKKSGDAGGSNGPKPVITSFSPDTGHSGTMMTIIGAHFSLAAGDNTVLIDSIKATVLHASADTLIVSVPTTHTGSVIVTTGGGTATGAIFHYTSDVLLSGFQTDFTYGSNYSVAVYWINGSVVPLTNGSSNASANCILSVGNDIYAGGHEYAGRYRTAKIWKNGTATTLSGTTEDADINAMVFSGKDQYAVGYSNNGGPDRATLWKNGVKTLLGDGMRNSYATGLALSGNDTYISGYTMDIAKARSQAVIWKNGVAQYLTDTTGDAQVNAVALLNNDVYAAGYLATTYGHMPAYWKNGVSQYDIVYNESAAYTSMAVSGDTVFMAGTLVDPYSYYTTFYLSTIPYNGRTVPARTDDHTTSSLVAVDGPDLYLAGTTGSPYRRVHYWTNGIDSAAGYRNDKTDNIPYGIFIRR